MIFTSYTILFCGYRAVRAVEDRRFLTTILVQMGDNILFYMFQMCALSDIYPHVANKQIRTDKVRRAVKSSRNSSD